MKIYNFGKDFTIKTKNILNNFFIGSSIAIGASFIEQYKNMYDIWRDIFIANMPSQEEIQYLIQQGVENIWGTNIITGEPFTVEECLTEGVSYVAIQSISVNDLIVAGGLGGVVSTLFLTVGTNLPNIVKYSKLKLNNRKLEQERQK